jgi:glutathione peroxidase-family protein
MVFRYLISLFVFGASLMMFAPAAHSQAANPPTSIYDFTVTSIDGNSVPLSKYKGQGFRILGFPANNFAHQEPGNNASIKEFCTSKYHVSFDMFSKLSVAGDDQSPLYAFLTDKTTDPSFGGPIEWNFAKFLVARDGSIVDRFPASHYPDQPDVVSAIEAALAK